MSDILRQLRETIRASGFTRYAISQGTGIDQGHLSKLMSGEAALGLAKAEALAAFLGLELVLRRKRKRKKEKNHGKHLS